MRIYDDEEDFFELDYWSDALLIEFEAGQGICVPKPEKNGKNYVYWDSTLYIKPLNMEMDLYKHISAVRFYHNYSMIDDRKFAATTVRTRDLN